MKFNDTEFSSAEIASKYLDGDIQSDNEWLQLTDDMQAKQAFERYQLIGGLMREEAISPKVSIADQVMAALDKEATIFAPKFAPSSSDQADDNSSLEETAAETTVVSFPRKTAKTVGGFAIAASVALVALMSTGNITPTETIQPQTLAATQVKAQQPNQQAQQQMALFNQARNAQGLPVIRTVSNQKALAISVPVEDVVSEPNKVEMQKQEIELGKDSKKEEAEAKN
ncbi:sigma-E factor negative regulatory protein [Kangiella sp. TOML190]|uniref:sigma-E factor negative regulatory protein n=1 Tax=Kangiella sp. TOML190 TaxID=2931351 RepID=UPI002040D532|nr:RseA family anti-sigma factor [Kangiella sp. TOML190]